MKNSGTGTKVLMAVVTLAVLAYFGMQGLRYWSDPFTTTVAYSYQVEESISATGYVARQERVLPDSSGGLLRLKRAEGEKVSAGGVVAVVYADQASLDRQNEIDSVKGQLEQLQYAEEAALGSEASLRLDAQIADRILQFRGAVAAARLDTAEDHSEDLKSLVLKRDYTYSDTADLSGEIAALQGELKAQQAKSAGSAKRITAPVSGLYSAVVDGYETVLLPDKLANLKPSELAAIQPDPGVSSQLGKLILGDAWYYVTTLSTEDAKRLEEQGELRLRFAKSVERDLSVTVESVGPKENGRSVVVLRGQSYLPQLTLLRQQSAELIQSSVAGIRVPKECIRATKTTVDKAGVRTECDAVGIYCVVGMEARFKPVELLDTGDSFVLVRAASDVEKTRLRPGDEVIISANDLYDGKVMR
ncbi:MAG: HlyD family efflux transporter periplasmic adaptor subunit [Oscillibacter sp.]